MNGNVSCRYPSVVKSPNALPPDSLLNSTDSIVQCADCNQVEYVTLEYMHTKLLSFKLILVLS